jgi:hypothetical protein
MLFRKRLHIECTFWGDRSVGDHFVGSLPEMSKWFTRRQHIPQIGEAVTLPPTIDGARAKPIDDEGYSTETCSIASPSFTGLVTGVLYAPDSNRISISVGAALFADQRRETPE